MYHIKILSKHLNQIITAVSVFCVHVVTFVMKYFYFGANKLAITQLINHNHVRIHIYQKYVETN